MNAGLIVNPKSAGRNEKGLELARMLADTPARVAVLERFEDLGEALRDFSRKGVSALFISSGDGTIQEIQTRIAEDPELFPTPPALGLLPHGSTNMTAADIGFRDTSLRRQRDYIQFSGWRAAQARATTRPTLRVANPADGKPRHGMFLGGGAIAAATLHCQQAFNDKGVRGQRAAFATLMSALRKALFSGPASPDDAGRLDRPFPMTIHRGDEMLADGLQLAMLATTLRKLVLGARPFWGGAQEGAMRVSIFGHPPPSLLRWLPFVLYGGETRRMPPSMTSLCASEIAVRTPSGFILDGEAFDPPADAPLRITTGADFTYLLG